MVHLVGISILDMMDEWIKSLWCNSTLDISINFSCSHILGNYWDARNTVSETKCKVWFSNLDVCVLFFLFQKNYCLFYQSMLFRIQFTFWHMTQIMSKYRILNNWKMLKSKTFFIPFSYFLKVFSLCCW